jgi:SAM-dependent methyltransferase
MKAARPDDRTFDAYAQEYDDALQQGLSVSGEDKLYFAQGRIRWLARGLSALHFAPRIALDFGCGTGTAVPLLIEHLGVTRVHGIDTSPESLAVARRRIDPRQASFFLRDDYVPSGSADLVFTNGVFHHIPPEERPAAVRYAFDALRPGGLLAFWENNPLNPGTRYVMSRIPFDRDAIPLTSREARALLRAGGFRIRSVDYLFIFPRLLKFLRPLEPVLSAWPLGAQYQVLAEKVSAGPAAGSEGNR